jgi:hypothetical protein
MLLRLEQRILIAKRLNLIYVRYNPVNLSQQLELFYNNLYNV